MSQKKDSKGEDDVPKWGRGKGRGGKTLHSLNIPDIDSLKYSTQFFSQYSTQLSNFYDLSDSRVILLNP